MPHQEIIDMTGQSRQQRSARDAILWQPILEAWSKLADDDEVVLVSDIVPSGFSDAELGVGQPQRPTVIWVWRKL